MNVDVFVVPYVTHITPQHISLNKKWKQLVSLQLADPEHAEEGPVDLLLGAGAFAELILEGLIKGPKGTPIAQKTKLGWILSGMSEEPTEVKCMMLKIKIQEPAELAFKKSIDISKTDGHFIVGLPFNKNPNDHDFLGDSYSIAKKRLFQQEKRLQTNEKLYEEYRKIIKEYVELKHMRLATPLEAMDLKHSYFVPHLPVVREDRATTKVRIVFDASAKSANGFSLNDRMLVGPKIQNDITALLIQFRKYPIALVADIEKMYRMIWLTETDALYQRILWRESPTEPVQQFLIKTVMFGNSSAPFQAIRALQEVANRVEAVDKVSAELIRHNFYVDDFITTVESEREAKQIKSNLTNCLATYGFKLHKWNSNVPELVNTQIHNSPHPMLTKHDAENKTLGMVWETKDDVFTFKHTAMREMQNLTKRQLSSEFAKIFDPLGFLSPWTCKSKMFIQVLWKRGLDWDEVIPDDITNMVKEQQKDWKNCEKIKIKRWVEHNSNDVDVTIHGFSDASKHAFAAVVYLRTVKADGSICVNLIMAKTKVAPLNELTIPRLELEASELLTYLMVSVKDALKLKTANIRCWTDSEVVLAWIKNQSTRRDIFVSNRISVIRKHTEPDQWHYVPSRLNPADCASRGIAMFELAEKVLWWHGPPFLQKAGKEEEMCSLVCLNIAITDDILMKFSDFDKLISVVAYGLRWRLPLNERGTTDL